MATEWVDLKSPTAPVRPAGWPELTSVAGSAELRPPGTARILKNWREPPQSEVSERVRSVLSKITTFQRKTSLSEWETLGQDTPVRQRRGAPKAEQHSPTRHRTRPGDKLKPIRKSIKVPSLKAAEILDDRLGLALGQPGGPVPDLPHGHPLLVDPTGPTSNVPVEIPHKSPALRLHVEEQPDMLVVNRPATVQPKSHRNKAHPDRRVATAAESSHRAAQWVTSAGLPEQNDGGGPAEEDDRIGSPRLRKFSESQPGWVGITVSLSDAPKGVAALAPPTVQNEQSRPSSAKKICRAINVVDGKWVASETAVDYVRVTAGPWGDVMPLIRRCEQLCQEWAIPSAQFSPPKLLRLAKLCSLGRDPHDDEMFDLATPPDSLAEYHHKPGQRFHGVGGAGRAILAIQTAYRQLRARWLVSGARKQAWAEQLVMTFVTVKLYARGLRIMRNRRLAEQDATFSQQQQELASRWGELQSGPHALIFLPSLDYNVHARALIKVPFEYEATQMLATVAALASGKAQHVTMVALCDDTFVNLRHSMDTAGRFNPKLPWVTNGQTVDDYMEEHVTVIVPEHRATFEPLNFPLAQHVLYSPVALTALETKAAEYPTTIVHTSVVGRPTLELAAHLSAWTVGSDIGTSALFCNASRCREIFGSAGIPTFLHVGDTHDLIDTLAELIATHTEIDSWLFFANSHREANGTAYFSIENLECMADICAKRRYIGEAKWPRCKTRNECAALLKGVLPDVLQEHIYLRSQARNASWSQFLADFNRDGGVVERFERSDFDTVNIDLRRSPDGKIDILSTSTPIYSSLLSPIALVVPIIPPVNHAMVTELVEKVGAALASRQFIGRIHLTAVLAYQPGMKVPTLHFRSATVGPIEHTAVLDCVETIGGLKYDATCGMYCCGDAKRFLVATSELTHTGLGMVTGAMLQRIIDLNYLQFRHDRVHGTVVFPFNAKDSSDLGAFSAGASLAEAATFLRNSLGTILTEAVGTETATENLSALRALVKHFITDEDVPQRTSDLPDLSFSIDRRPTICSVELEQ